MDTLTSKVAEMSLSTPSLPSNVREYPCNPVFFYGKTKIRVTLFKKTCMVRQTAVLKVLKAPVTIGEEVDEILREWYSARGQSVPPHEVGIGAKIDTATLEEEARIQKMQSMAGPIGEKPEFGTSAFWAWTRAKTAQENRYRAEKGLPPLPTKKEKEAAKVAAKEARLAVKAAKLAKVAKKN